MSLIEDDSDSDADQGRSFVLEVKNLDLPDAEYEVGDIVKAPWRDKNGQERYASCEVVNSTWREVRKRGWYYTLKEVSTGQTWQNQIRERDLTLERRAKA